MVCLLLNRIIPWGPLMFCLKCGSIAGREHVPRTVRPAPAPVPGAGPGSSCAGSARASAMAASARDGGSSRGSETARVFPAAAGVRAAPSFPPTGAGLHASAVLLSSILMRLPLSFR
jgi:hypothetical protein